MDVLVELLLRLELGATSGTPEAAAVRGPSVLVELFLRIELRSAGRTG